MSKVIAVSTNKGGVLKTSITVNLASVLSKAGHKILIVDTDNQGNAYLSFGGQPDELEHSIYDVMLNKQTAKNSIINIHHNIDILPSNDDMSFLDFDILTNIKTFKSPFTILSDRLGSIKKHYDYILIDTPPNLGLTQGNVLTFADSVLIPFQPEVYSMRSLVKMLGSIQSFKKKYNPKLEVQGVVATLVDQRTTLHGEVLQQARRYCYEKNIKMFETVIPRTIRYASSIAYERIPATLSEKNNNLIQSYYDLVGEMTNE